MEISDVFPQNGDLQRIYCVKCGEHSDLVFNIFNEHVSGVSICIEGLPVLRCVSCGSENLPDLSRLAIIETHRRAFEQSEHAVHVRRRKRTNNFGFTQVQFDYDPDDYYYIPGLTRPFDQGFLEPVFFNRIALLKYENAPGYRVQFASTTYGTIYTEDQGYISFGINRFGKLVMWLGDIATLPMNEQYYLRSENVPSDHSIGSEFYDGQIEVKFTDPTAENNLFKLRSAFIDASFVRFGRKLGHLEAAAYDLALSFNPPVVDTPKERRHVADSLNKIYLESFDNSALDDVVKLIGGNAKGSGSLKRLEAILESIAPTADISSTMLPFYVLYDFRVACSHLTSGGEGSTMESVKKRLGLDLKADLSSIYQKLISRMADSFEKMTIIVSEK